MAMSEKKIGKVSVGKVSVRTDPLGPIVGLNVGMS